MKITYDKIADAAYMTLRKGRVSKTVEMSDNVIVDFDRRGNLLGIEMLSASKQFPRGSIAKKSNFNIPIKNIARVPIAA